MIRLFDVFSKGHLEKVNAMVFFLQCMSLFEPDDHECPTCGTQHPGWKRHGQYMRNLISFELGQVVTCRITVLRYKCLSCQSTHAILPASITPYGPYSLLFILAVLRDHYSGSLTVQGICHKYSISQSTLYEWKALYRQHKRIWLGLLSDAAISPLQFLEGFLKSRIHQLGAFFRMAGVSFLQRRRKTAQSAPV